jgi:hypothetical protein
MATLPHPPQEERKDTSATRKRNVLSDAVLVSLAGVLAYSLTFLHEAAYFRTFGLPLHLVQTNLDTALAVAVAAGGFAFCCTPW